jgi:hypothetical protein
MSLSLLPLLIFEDDVPPRARAALRQATLAPAGERQMYLEVAARELNREANIDCADARELVGLS